MKKTNFVKTVLCVSAFLAFMVYPHQALVSAQEGEISRIVVGSIKIFPTNSPKRVVIGNPDIADIADVTNNEITVTAKAAGMTTLVYWDVYGEQSYKIKVLAEDVNDIKTRVDSLLKSLELKEVYTQTAEDEAKVLLLGRVRSKEDTDRIITALGPLKDKVVDLSKLKEEETVIEIDVQILEMDRDSTKQLGFNWPESISLLEIGSPALGAAGTSWGQLWKISNIGRASITADGVVANPFAVTLDLMMREGKARILSRPRLSCQSGKTAKLVVGGEVPVLSSSVSGGGTVVNPGAAEPGNITYKEYGIILDIVPTITNEDRISLNLNVEVSDIAEQPVSTTYALAYPLTKRTATTMLSVDDGQPLAIGGLIKQRTQEDLRKFPFLADVPVLGAFFRHKTTKTGGGDGKKSDTELFIIMTPRVVSHDELELPKKEIAPAQKVLTQEETFARANIPENMLNYTKAVQIKILRSIYYPKAAREAGWQGCSRLGLLIASDGTLLDAKIAKSSGYKILDDAALDVAKKQSPFPPFPPQIESEEVSVEVPVVYRKE